MTTFEFQTNRLVHLMSLPGVAMAAASALGLGNKVLPAGILLEHIDTAIAEAAKPVATVRVYAKKPGEPVHAYDIEADRNDAIKAVRDEGYPRAMVLVPKAFLQLEFKSCP